MFENANSSSNTVTSNDQLKELKEMVNTLVKYVAQVRLNRTSRSNFKKRLGCKTRTSVRHYTSLSVWY